jgi:hypothetical protein
LIGRKAAVTEHQEQFQSFAMCTPIDQHWSLGPPLAALASSHDMAGSAREEATRTPGHAQHNESDILFLRGFHVKRQTFSSPRHRSSIQITTFTIIFY